MVGGGDFPTRPAARPGPIAIPAAPTRSHARTHGHSHPLPSRSTARPPSRLHTNTSVPWTKVRQEHGLLKGDVFLFPVDTSQDTQVYCSKPPRNAGLAQTLEFSSRCQVRMPAGPPPAVLGSIVLAGLLVQAQGQVGLGAHHWLFKSLIKSLLRRLGGEKAKQLLGGGL